MPERPAQAGLSIRPGFHVVVVISGIVDLGRRETRHEWRPRTYSEELRERAVGLVRESERGIAPVARDPGLNPETLRGWVRQAEADGGSRSDRLASAGFTFIRTWQGWAYLALVIDVHTRMIVGWQPAPGMRHALVDDALAMAIELRSTLTAQTTKS